MARTPLFSLLIRLLHQTESKWRRGTRRNPARSGLSRRQWLGAAATLGVSCAAPSATAPASPAFPPNGTPPVPRRVAVVGAGLAGLTCAYRLKQRGVEATVFDAQTRTGGRVWSTTDGLAGGQVAELGGEFIDTNHIALKKLARELGLELDDLVAARAGLRADTFFFDGALLSEASVVEAFRPLAERMQADLTKSEADDAAFAALDRTSIAEYLSRDSDLDPKLKKLIEVAYVGEYGRESDEQTCFNLLWLIDSRNIEPFRIFGESDERYRVRGGNQRFTDGLAATLQPQLELGQRLIRVKGLDAGFELTFDVGGSAREQLFDQVVLTLPFTLLREVELQVRLPSLKREMIRSLGYGTNAKLMLQFDERVWSTAHRASGSCFTDNGLQGCWDTSRAQPGDFGLLTVFMGGHGGESLGRGSPEEQALTQLQRIEAIFPGTRAKYRPGTALRMHWPSMPFTKGSYACFLPGQARFSGHEAEPVGHLYFAGEHTSEDFQGYMNGAVESGERAAEQVLAG